MQKTRVMVAGTAILLSFIATTPQAAAGWQETEWGMTQDEVQNAVPDHHGDEKLIVWHGLHGPVPILIHIRPCGSGKATPAARREAPC
ncbi:hypothetical protein F1642_14005 [Paracoccus sp. NBH48]|jgi:hypothetical protein|uniref:hypothetical protein n=1 Tax=Paracoccus sp. NBH48 TaxID=2596918 RepID=UPI00189149D1|nr:hypothetical protein [Paracoccus sp. NBH48]MBF5080033.1 hypothetical protein [Paracoccus sp. NBH48]